jgi:hypothetical protein
MIWMRILLTFYVAWPVSECNPAALGECAWTARQDTMGMGLR